MNTRSIYFRLIGLYVGLLTVVMLAVGLYTYKRLEDFLLHSLRTTIEQRTRQISQTISQDLSAHNDGQISEEINSRYTPAMSDKFVRITLADSILIHLSKPPFDKTFTPEKVPLYRAESPALSLRKQTFPDKHPLLIASLSFTKGGRNYMVEVGASLANSNHILRALLVALVIGFAFLICVAIVAGYALMKRAFTPVENIMAAAQEISLHHLNRRLPVSDRGDEIANLSITLNRMIARLDESFQHTSRFTADASHELRTPLTIIHGELEAILSGQNIAPEQREAMLSLLDEVKRLVRIVEGLFSLARLDIAHSQNERVRVDLGKLVETTAEQMCILAEEKHISLTCKTREADAVLGDRARLKQVIVNLLDNAIKYTPENGTITVLVYGTNSETRMEISDTGPGVSGTALPHLFERFFRAEDTRSSKISGAGLGLSIVQSICTAHGGSVTAENKKPTGLKITVKLPKAPPQTRSNIQTILIANAGPK